MTSQNKPQETSACGNSHGRAFLAAPLLLALIFMGPAILRNKTFYAFDILGVHAPWADNRVPARPHNGLISDPVSQFFVDHQYYHRTMAQHDLPLWNPLNFCGQPHPLYMNPLLYLLFGILPVTWAHDLLLFMCLAGAGLCTYAFLRKLDICEIAALIGAAAWMFNGYVMVWFEFENTPMMTFSLAAILLALELWLQHRNRMSFLWLVAAIAFSISCNYVHLLVYTHLLAGAYALHRYHGLRRTRADAGAGVCLGGILSAFLAALVISCSLFAVSLSTYGESQRVHYPFSQLYERTGRVHVSHLATMIFPNLYGSPTQALSFPPKTPGKEPYNNYNELCVYAGVMPLLLAVACIAFARRRGVAFFICSGLLSLNLAMGSILYYPFARFVPGFDLSTPTRTLFIFGFSVAVLAGLGADSLIRLKSGRGRLLVCGAWAAVAVAAVASLLRLQSTANIERIARELPWLQHDLVTRYLQAHFSFTHAGNLRAMLLLAACIIILAALVLLREQKQKMRVLIIVLLIVLVDLVPFGLDYNTTTLRMLAYPPTPGIRFLQKDRSKFRVLWFGKFFYNWLAGFNIEDICGYRSFYGRRYRKYLKLSQQQQGLLPHMDQWLICRDFGSPLLDMLNIKYVILPRHLNYLNPKLRLVHEGDMNIYENKAAFPRAFFAGQYEVCASEQELMTRLGQSTAEDLRRRVLLEAEPESRFRLQTRAAAKVTIESYTANRVEITVDASGPGFLVMSDSYNPNWRALVSNVVTPVMRANAFMRAVPVPGGRHHVILQYRPWPVIISLAVSACGWIALLCAIGYYWPASRRKNAAHHLSEEST